MYFESKVIALTVCVYALPVRLTWILNTLLKRIHFDANSWVQARPPL